MIKKLLGQRVLVKRDYLNEKSSLVISKDDDLELNTGQIIYIGDDIADIKMGDRILFEELAGQSVDLNNERYLVLNYENVIAIL